MAADYTVTFTDPLNGSFVIKPLTTNGPATPAAAVPLDSKAVSANTSIILLGKGMELYGERIANNLVHMIEHFANASPPAYPIQGQLWFDNSANTLNVYDGVTWNALQTATITADFDMLGFKIINLGAPTNPGDAVNLGYADTNYVNVSGDTMTGFLILNADPVVPLGAATKQYVDAAVSGGGVGIFVQIAGDTMTGPLVVNSTITTSDNIEITTGDFLVDDGTIETNGDIILNDLSFTIVGVNTGFGGYWDIAGNVASKFPAGKTFSVSGNAGGPTVNVSYQVVSATNVGPNTRLDVVFIDVLATVSGTVLRPGIVTIPSLPNNPTDATNKDYVDQQIALVSGGGAPLLLSGGSMNPGANITLSAGGEILGLPSLPTTPGSAVSFEYVENIYTLDPPPQSPSYLRDNAGLAVAVPPAAPLTYSVQEVVDALDFGLGVVGGVQFEREVFRGDGTTTQFTLPFTYLTESDKLEVFVDGIKQYRTFRGKSYVKLNPTTSYDKYASGGDATGLPANTYDFNIDVDGAGVVNIPVVVPANSTFNSLLVLINDALKTAEVPANCALLSGTYKFYSYKQDVPSFTASVSITAGTTDLFSAITGPVAPLTAPQRTIVGGDNTGTNDYFTVSADVSTIFQAGTPFIVSGSTGGLNDGTYTVKALAYDWTALVTRIYTVGAIPSTPVDGTIAMFEFYATITNYAEPSPVTYGAGVNRYREAGELLALVSGGLADQDLRYFDVAGTDITSNLVVGSKLEVVGGANAGIYTIRGFNYNTTVAGRTVVFVEEAIPSAVITTTTNINYYTPALIDCNMITFDVGTVPAANSIIEVRLSR